ncbi:MAG: hypothetical protein SNH88_05115 [Rikenellaceae bacterium]
MSGWRVVKTALFSFLLSSCATEGVAFLGISEAQMECSTVARIELMVVNDTPKPITIAGGEIVISSPNNFPLATLKLAEATTIEGNSGEQQIATRWDFKIEDPALILKSERIIASIGAMKPNVEYRVKLRRGILTKRLHEKKIPLKLFLPSIEES